MIHEAPKSLFPDLALALVDVVRHIIGQQVEESLLVARIEGCVVGPDHRRHIAHAVIPALICLPVALPAGGARRNGGPPFRLASPGSA